ncbi:MAG: hypothetical protein PWP23_657 [Candidatus Sumerlaeota bacterium]|nr:hypothetical protein [Candidatus Sumerlaeota bacterium]
MRANLPVILLVFFGLLVLSPFYRSSGTYPFHSLVKWDTMMLQYPRLVYASDTINYARQLPLWNPFQDFGFPFVIDAQSQLWSPVTWAILIWLQYDIHTVQLQLVLTFLLAGLGAYALARTLGHRRWIAWMAGASYMFSGYFLSYAGLLGTFSTMAWYPWPLACAIRAWKEEPHRRLGWMALAGVLLAQASVGGHPTTAMVAAVNLAGLFIAVPLRKYSRAQRAGGLLLCAVVCAAIVAPQMTGVFASRDYLPAYQRLPLERIESDPLFGASLLGFLIPEIALAPIRAHFESYPSHLGSYAGLLTLVGLVLALARRRWNPQFRVLLVAAGINLLLAMGPANALRQALYFWVPGMDGPHHTSMDFRGFTILYLILGACTGWSMLAAVLRSRHWLASRVRKGLLFASALLAMMAFALLVGESALPQTNTSANVTIAKFTPETPVLLSEMFFRQAVTCATALFLLALVHRAKWRNRAIFALCLFVAFDMASAAKRSWSLVADTLNDSRMRFVGNIESHRPRYFEPLQFLKFDDQFPNFDGFIVHHVDLDAYNPPLKLRWPHEAKTIKDFEKEYRRVLPHRGAVLTPKDEWLNKGEARLMELTPNTMTWRVEAPGEDCRLIVLTSYFPGWSYTIDGEQGGEVGPSTVGRHFLDVPVPSGSSSVVFSFQPKWLWPSIWVMLIGYLVGGVLTVFYLRRPLSRP